jgi:hypothetical protein
VNKADFIDLLLGNDQGQIVLSNILNGLDEGLFEVAFVHMLFDWWIDLCDSKSYTTSTTVLAALNVLIFKSQPPGFRPHLIKPNFKLTCRRLSRHSTDSELTTVVSAFVLGLIIHADDKRRLIAAGFEFPTSYDQAVSDSALAKLMALPELSRKIRLDVNSKIGGTDLVWFTPRLGLERVLATMANCAEKARDMLGLANKKPGDVMIALHFSATALKYVTNARPTFADAGNEPRFKALADSTSLRKRKAWGYTANLDHFATGKIKLDGLPERVSAPIDKNALKEAPEIVFAPLGRVSTNRGHTASDSHAQFAIHLRNQKSRSTNDMRREMIAII